MYRVVFFCFCGLFCVNAEYLIKKLCKDEEIADCDVHNVELDLCANDEPAFCTVKRNKRYTLSLDFTPRFSTKRLNLAMYADDNNTGTFDKVIKTPEDACDMLTCPVDANVRRIFDVNFSLNKRIAVAKFPVKVKVWSEEDEAKICCFTFNVKISK